jgi:hypothetical protein
MDTTIELTGEPGRRPNDMLRRLDSLPPGIVPV